MCPPAGIAGLVMSKWGGRRVTRLRKQLEQLLPVTCARCGQLVLPGQRWDVGHVIGRDIAPELTWDPSQWRIEHAYCNRSQGAKYGNRKRGRRRRIPPTSRDW